MAGGLVEFCAGSLAEGDLRLVTFAVQGTGQDVKFMTGKFLRTFPLPIPGKP